MAVPTTAGGDPPASGDDSFLGETFVPSTATRRQGAWPGVELARY